MRHRAPRRSALAALAQLRRDLPRGRSTAVIAALTLTMAGCGAGSAIVGVHQPPAQVTTTASITVESARDIAVRVLADADRAATVPASEAQQVRQDALTGGALTVAEAASKVGGSGAAATQPMTRTQPPKVLAISRGTSWPRVILVQSSNADGAAVLNLLMSPDARTPFRLAARATMHPGAAVAALDPLVKGSPLVTDDSTVATPPKALLTEYAASLAYPKPAAAKDVDEADPFSTAVRANAAAQAKALGKLASLTQTHRVHPDQTYAIGLRGGGAIVFALLERTDTLSLGKGGKSLTPSPQVQRLVKKKALSKSARLTTYETVVLTVPTEGRSQVVAADEVLVSAQGA